MPSLDWTRRVLYAIVLASVRAWTPHAPSDTDRFHAAGLRPHHASGQSNDDPLLFRHRYQHHDQETNRLVYYQYEARRHAHVVHFDDLAVESCSATPGGVEGTLLLTLIVRWGDEGHHLRALKAGAILIGSDASCTGKGGMPATITGLRERLLADATLRKADGEGAQPAAEVTLHTATAGFHECFEYSQLEFFRGCVDEPHSRSAQTALMHSCPCVRAQECGEPEHVKERASCLICREWPHPVRRSRVCEHGRCPEGCTEGRLA